MIYPKNFEEKIGFNTIREMLEEECLSTMGLDLCSSLKFLKDRNQIETYLNECMEMKRVLMLESSFPSQDYLDLRQELKSITIEGGFISLDGLKALSISYGVIVAIKKYILNLDEEVYPNLRNIASSLDLVDDLLYRIGFLLDPITKELRDNASEDLYRIRTAIRKKTVDSFKLINKYLALAKKEAWASETAEISQRGERLVIPMIASHKRQIKGFVHDISATGQTVFLEPDEVFSSNNELSQLRQDEKIEIIKILKEFSSYLAPLVPQLLKAYSFLGKIDFVRAKAKLALKLDASMPIINENLCFSWRKARHPLLKEAVPLDFILEGEERIVIISGPNAGGKSVCIKTIGLLQYMLQCGLLVPMLETSEVGIFGSIFIDIGDEQSIENELSTYSSHLKNMKFWLSRADDKTLFIADELGSGTEPQSGCAIAEALLEQMAEKGAWGIATTHFTQLKLLSKKHKEMVNAAMLFNKEEMKPLYIFKKGLPGSSFAFEMAKNIGLPNYFLRRAEKKLGRTHLNFEQELQQIEVEKQKLQKEREDLEVADRILESTINKYSRLTSEIEEKKQIYIKEAKQAAAELLSKTNQRIEKTIRDIREAQAQKEETQRLRKQLGDDLKNITTSVDEALGIDFGDKNLVLANKAAGAYGAASHGGAASVGGSKHLALQKLREEAANLADAAKFAEGDLVKRKSGLETGTIVKLKGKKALVDFDFISMELPLDQLQKLTPKELRAEKERSSRVSIRINSLQEGKNEFKPYLDLRGVRLGEAMEMVEKFVDEAVLYGESRLEVLHGKGYGILKENIREALRRNPHVASFKDQEEDMGGSGITIINVK